MDDDRSIADVRAVGSVPSIGRFAVHLRRGPVFVGDGLLGRELLVALVGGFVADIGEAFLLVLVGADDLPLVDRPMELIGRELVVELLLLGILWRATDEAGGEDLASVRGWDSAGDQDAVRA